MTWRDRWNSRQEFANIFHHYWVIKVWNLDRDRLDSKVSMKVSFEEALKEFCATCSRQRIDCRKRISLSVGGPNTCLHSHRNISMFVLGDAHRKPPCAFCGEPSVCIFNDMADRFPADKHNHSVCANHIANVTEM